MATSETGESASHALKRRGLNPRKRLGQNFLRDRRFLERILEAARVGPEDEVLEVGAGTGILTAALLGRARRVVAVELDDALYRLLEEQFADEPTLELVHGNALNYDPCAGFGGPYTLVGNIPYYVTGPILRHFLEAECQPALLVLMVQREVAERMTAGPGELSLFGVSVQYYARPEIVTRVPAGAFYPRPNVDSAIVRLVPHAQRPPRETRSSFFEVVRAGFGTRRKTLANALALGLGMSREDSRALLQAAGIDESRRAETLTPAEWERVVRAWRARGKEEGRR